MSLFRFISIALIVETQKSDFVRPPTQHIVHSSLKISIAISILAVAREHFNRKCKM